MDENKNKMTEKNKDTGSKEPSAKKKLSKKQIILICILGAVVLIALAAGLYVNAIVNNPQSLFEDVNATPEPEPSPSAEQPTGLPQEEEDEPSEYDKLLSEADKAMMDGILNVVLVGVDHAEERDSEKWNGKRDFHADVILVLAINFNENTVDMISIPRDTYANIPGVKGIYKINASLDLGGGMYAENGKGFEKVCETASWMLGGMNVDYYVGVDMNAVKALGDAIGGVDFDLEVDFNLGGRYYKKGLQHMDGQGILDYMRVRKPGNIASSHQGDQRRVNRQKKMLVAVFESMKKNNLLTSIPKIISAFNGNLYTNLSTSQIAALAVFGYNLDSENIAMHSMGGSGGKIGEWNFVFTDQKKRVSIIEEVYGVTADKYTKYTSRAADEKYAEIAGTYITDSVSKALSDIKAMLGLNAPQVTPAPVPSQTAPPTAPPTSSPAPSATQTPAPSSTQTPAPSATQTPAPSSTQTPAPSSPSAQPGGSVLAALSRTELAGMDSNIRPLSFKNAGSVGTALLSVTGASPQELYYAAEQALETYKNDKTGANFDTMKTAVTALCNAVGYSTRSIKWYYPFDEKYNEIFVDFR